MLEMFLIFVILLIVFYKTGILKGALEEGKNNYKSGYYLGKRTRAAFGSVFMIIGVPIVIIILYLLVPYVMNNQKKELMKPFIGRYKGSIEIGNYTSLILEDNYQCKISSEDNEFTDCRWDLDNDVITITVFKNSKETKYQGKIKKEGILINYNLIVKYE